MINRFKSTVNIPIYLIILLVLACIIACGQSPLNRVPPKTEVYYSGKTDPCSKDEDANDLQNKLDPDAD